ncbi:hypothetical protein BaOVIS_015510 [Babesia ovis]|uniref:Uncharacterized protein n=1 Tax=Babesia ovis TaxID=5869 RepID=A0A9W5WVB6_BABOV|nr:hypothetical protein BaOVIS_015510 [Babesia ovis]
MAASDTSPPAASDLPAKSDESSSSNGKEYGVLDLHINQFLSFIAEEYSFLPCAIYRPRIDVYLENKLVYKSRVLSHEDDIFDNAIRIRIQSPNSVLTLKLYECVDLRLTERCVDDIIRPMLREEVMDEVLISWCNIDLALLIPGKTYRMVSAFRVNPMFLNYNPGGILYYPIVDGRPNLDTQRVCCACRVCAYLASNTTSVHKKALDKYFDFRSGTCEITTPTQPVKKINSRGIPIEENSTKGPVEGEIKSDAAVVNTDTDVKDSNVISSTEELDYTKEVTDDVPYVSQKMETFDLNVKKAFFTKEGCTCCKLMEIPNLLSGINYSFCACCHDYQVCCGHSLDNYYFASISLKLVSKAPIDFKAELYALMSTPIDSNVCTPQTDSLCEIVTRSYELLEAIRLLGRHLGLTSVKFTSPPYVNLFLVLLMVGYVFDDTTLTVTFFVLTFMILYLHTTSLKQYRRDFGDVIEASKRYTISGLGLEKAIQDVVEEDEDANAMSAIKARFQRNMKCLPTHEFADEVKIFSKLNTSFRRRENISIKTLTQFLSTSIPQRLRMRMVNTLNFLEACVWYANAMLALIRRFGVVIAAICCAIGLLSIRYTYWIKCFIKMILFVFVSSLVIEQHPFVKNGFMHMGYVLKYVAMRVYRREWFLNVDSFP